MCDVTTEPSFVSQAMCVIDVFAYYLNRCPRVFFNQALADVRSTGAGIKYLHCLSSSELFFTLTAVQINLFNSQRDDFYCIYKYIFKIVSCLKHM